MLSSVSIPAGGSRVRFSGGANIRHPGTARVEICNPRRRGSCHSFATSFAHRNRKRSANLRRRPRHGIRAAHACCGCETVVSLGFCLGGRFAFLTAASRFGLSGAIGLYGYPDRFGGADGPLQVVDDLTAPMLGLWAGADEGIPATLVAEFDAALTAAGNEHEFVTYPGAPHGFFEANWTEFADACADAWRRVLAFIERSAASRSAA